jgi:ABC-type nitrate/sulfonate/bicarbonate transport system substrate-binding protein
MLTPSPTAFRKGRGRPLSEATPAAPPAPVTVVAVVFFDANHVYWKFSSPVVSWDDVSGLTVVGQSPSELDEITPEGWLLVGYDGAVAVGDAWEVTPGITINFESGTELELPESATVNS